jgi:hypothetical protein
VLCHRLSRFLERISRGGNDTDALVGELVGRALEGSQLLLAVRSPVRAVGEKDAPAPLEGLREAYAAMIDGVELEDRKPLAAVEDVLSGSRHSFLLI